MTYRALIPLLCHLLKNKVFGGGHFEKCLKKGVLHIFQLGTNTFYKLEHIMKQIK